LSVCCCRTCCVERQRHDSVGVACQLCGGHAATCGLCCFMANLQTWDRMSSEVQHLQFYSRHSQSTQPRHSPTSFSHTQLLPPMMQCPSETPTVTCSCAAIGLLLWLVLNAAAAAVAGVLHSGCARSSSY
jgi:hypothetical protein